MARVEEEGIVDIYRLEIFLQTVVTEKLMENPLKSRLVNRKKLVVESTCSTVP